MASSLETNKQTVREFYELAFNQRKPAEAAAKHIGSYYRQHNPQAPDGPEAFIEFVNWFTSTYPQFKIEIKRMIAEGDYVATHSKLLQSPDGASQAVVDFFRLENGKIVEHWDVVQDVPPTSANNNTMF